MRRFVIGAALPSLAACAAAGDAGAVREANELAIACRYDAALAAADRAMQGGGISGGVAQLQKVVILRDAGRRTEADAVLRARNANPYVSAENAADTEKAIRQSLSDLREERFERTGSRTCS
jgi:hypothetical protein